MGKPWRRIQAVVVLLAVVVLGAACSGDPGAGNEPEPVAATEPEPVDSEPASKESPSPSPTPSEERPGTPEVYERIAATTDCAALQEEFDRAAANNETAAAGSAEQDWTLAYMEAADERMAEVGCYDS